MPKPPLILGPFVALWLASPGFAAPQIPAPPEYSVLDQPDLLSPTLERALETALVEHERLTSEHLVVAILSERGASDAESLTKRIAAEWQVGRGNPTRGILLAYYSREKDSRVEIGVGFDSVLTPDRARKILSETLRPEARMGDPGRGIALAALEILRSIESPLLPNGRAEELLRAGGLRGELAARIPPPSNRSWATWIVFGIIISISVTALLTSAEAHYTRSGWIHPKPWENWRARILKKIRRRRSVDHDVALGGTYGSW